MFRSGAPHAPSAQSALIQKGSIRISYVTKAFTMILQGFHKELDLDFTMIFSPLFPRKLHRFTKKLLGKPRTLPWWHLVLWNTPGLLSTLRHRRALRVSLLGIALLRAGQVSLHRDVHIRSDFLCML